MEALEESFWELQIQSSSPEGATGSKITTQSGLSVKTSQTSSEHPSTSTLGRTTVIDGLELHKSSVIEDRLKTIWRKFSSLYLIIYEHDSR